LITQDRYQIRRPRSLSQYPNTYTVLGHTCRHGMIKPGVSQGEKGVKQGAEGDPGYTILDAGCWMPLHC